MLIGFSVCNSSDFPGKTTSEENRVFKKMGFNINMCNPATECAKKMGFLILGRKTDGNDTADVKSATSGKAGSLAKREKTKPHGFRAMRDAFVPESHVTFGTTARVSAPNGASHPPDPTRRDDRRICRRFAL